MKKEEPSPPKVTVFEPQAVEARLKTWFPDLKVEVLQQLVVFQAELIKFNKNVSMIPSSSLRNVESLHVADAILASLLMEPNLIPQTPLFDIEGGNGLPGLVYSMVVPARSVVVCDRDPRKIEFCQTMARTFGLKNVTFQKVAAEEMPAASVKNVVIRSTLPFSRVLLSTRKLVANGGRFYHLKGDGWANELANMPSQVFTHWAPQLLGKYRLPETTTEMFVILTEKTSD